MGNALIKRSGCKKSKKTSPAEKGNGKKDMFLKDKEKPLILETKASKGESGSEKTGGSAKLVSDHERNVVNNHAYIEFLRFSWPGSILCWDEKDIFYFASCFTPHKVAAGQEISTKDTNSFFIIVEGNVEVHAILPTIRKKTGHIREFLCKKSKGDMVYIPSVRELISESNAREIYSREDHEHKEHTEHKNVLDLIDTITILATDGCTILQLDWGLFQAFIEEKEKKQNENDSDSDSEKIELDIDMLQTIMKTNLTDYLVNIPIMETLPYSKLEIVSSLCQYCIEKEGSVICREGDIGDEVYILLCGEVKVEVQASKRMVELFTEGILSLPVNDTESSNSNSETESNMTGTDPGYKRKGSVQYKCDYDSQTNYSMKRMSKAQRNYTKRRQTMMRASLDYKKEQTAASQQERKLQRVSSLPSPPSTNSKLKRTSTFHLDKDSHFVELGRFGRGDYFGEMATFIELPRAATVTSTTNVLMAKLSKTAFRNLYHVFSPELESQIENMVKVHMLHTLLQSKSPFLEVISTDHAERMAKLTHIVKVEQDKVIFKEDDQADKFYFVYSGKLVVEKKLPDDIGMKQIGLLLPGDYFGEMAVLNKTRRLATIRASKKSVLLEITRDNFHDCFEEFPEIISELVVRMKGNGVDLKSILEYPKSKKVFATYLEQENKHLYLDCYDRIIDYKHKITEGVTVETIKNEARSIKEKYLSDSCIDWHKSEVSILENNINKISEDEASKENCFECVEKELFRRLETEILPTFKENDLFHSFMTKIRAYDEVDVALLA